MPTEAENVQYLYLVLTNDGTPTIDWDAVGAALQLNKGAVSKRWSRLRQSMEKGESPGGSTYQFLWLCVKHSKRDTAMNWAEIAEKCNTTSGAASKRYSRMKQAFEQGVAPPGPDPVKNTPSKAKATPKSTPRKRKATTTTPSGDDDDDKDIAATPTPKRKRASPKKKTPAAAEEQKFKADPEDDVDDEEEEEEQTLKRAKGAKGKVTLKPKAKTSGAVNNKKEKAGADLLTPTTEATTFIKDEEGEGEGEEGDAFYDAREHVEADAEQESDGRVRDWLSNSA